jgi:lipoteichoic acid synthase
VTILKKALIYISVFFVSLFFIEILFKLLFFSPFFDWALLRIILFTVSTSLFLGIFVSFFPSKVSKRLTLIIIGFVSLYTLIQMGFKGFMGNFMSLNIAGDGFGRVTKEIPDFIKFLRWEFFLVFIPFIILIFVFKKHLKEPLIKSKHYFFFGSLVLLAFLTHYIGLATLKIGFMQNEFQTESNLELYKKPLFQELCLKQFGTTRFLSRDITYLITKGDGQSEIEVIENDDDEKETDFTRKINDDSWLSRIDIETNTRIKALDNYYINQSITPKNEMTGKFEGMNFIYIMVEAFDLIAINEQLTPTLYKMANEGIYFTNHYSPKYSCTTGESEFIGLVSLVPSSDVCTPNQYRNNYYPTAMFSLFNNMGYTSTSYHNYIDKFYDRRTIHKNMGSSAYYNRDNLDIDVLNGWPSDIQLAEEAWPIFSTTEPFFSFIITSSTHFPYDIDSTIVNRHWDDVKDLPYNIKQKRYLAKAIELDKMVEYLIEQLDAKGILNNTIISMFSDHHPLKMEFKYLDELSDIDRLEDLNIDRTPWIIYNPRLQATKIETVTSTFDIIPTIANLFDLDYDPRYYFGTDAFGEEERLVIFANGSWITEKGIYNAIRGTFKNTTEEEMTDDYIKEKSSFVKNSFNVSNETYKTNYFKYRFPDKVVDFFN